MATIFSHALAGATLVTLFPKKFHTSKVYWVAACSAIIPDLDYLGFIQRVPYQSLWGHRGMTHSLVFAICFAIATAFFVHRKLDRTVFGFSILFFLTTISHAFLDAFTNGGLGVAFFAPYNLARYFFPWRPIEVSPMGLGFFSERGLAVLLSEFYWIALPCFILVVTSIYLKRKYS